MLLLTIYGVPQSQGSMRAFHHKKTNRIIVTSTNKNLRPWRQDVAIIAKEEMQKIAMSIIRRPHAVRIGFYFVRPQSTKKTIIHKTTAPDLDKTLRALADALTGICYEDDAQVSQCWVSKAFDVTPRSVVRVTALTDSVPQSAEMPQEELLFT